MRNKPKAAIVLPERTRLSGLEIPAGKSNLACVLLDDRLIIKETSQDTYEGTMILKGDDKLELRTGTIESIGSVVPTGYERLALNQHVHFKAQTGIQVEIPEDPTGTYWMVRIVDASTIL